MSISRPSPLQHEIRQSRPFLSPAQEAAISILRTADHVRRQLTAAIAPSGITFQQYNVLRVLRGALPDPLPTLEIGERLIERTPGITRLLDRLEAKSLVRRDRSSDDRRLVHCWITDAGLDLLGTLDAAVDEADVSAVAMLDPQEILTLTSLLAKVRRTG